MLRVGLPWCINELGRYPNQDYALLAYEVGHCLVAACLLDRVIFSTDAGITGPEMDVPDGTDDPVVPRRRRDQPRSRVGWWRCGR